jgi:Fic family protein
MNKFDIDTFVIESNKIDPQYGYFGDFIPGSKPGELLYDNQQNAFEIAIELAKTQNKVVTEIIPRSLHAALGKNVDFFELNNARGTYRNHNVKINGKFAPEHYLVPSLMRELWVPMTQTWLKQAQDNQIDPVEAAWNTHHLFEVIHPFLDGNGRTGRLILNWFLMACEQEPIIIYHDKKNQYYDSIQEFRDNKYPEIYQNWINKDLINQ